MVARAAVRILCVDEQHRILLMRWRDPATGDYVWEPPGGGIEAGERPIDAARRELGEETGLPGAAVIDRHTMLRRHAYWNGEYFDGEEAFFIARFDSPPSLSRDRLQAYETGWLDSHRWVRWDDVSRLEDTVEPPELVSVLATLDPAGPWAREA